MKKIDRVTIAAIVSVLICLVLIASAEAGVIVVGPRVWGPRPYYYPYPYYVYPTPPVVVRQPEVYVQQEPAPSTESNYWYFCKEAQGYYPYVKQCPSGWMKVVPSAPRQASPPPAQ